MRLKFIVTGTGRSGTVYMARVLTSLGVPCGHESVFTQDKERKIMGRLYGFVEPTISDVADNHGWLEISELVADSSYMAVPYLGHEEIQEIPVIHVVREPLSVISSFVKDLKYFQLLEDNEFNAQGWEDWMYSQVTEINMYETPLERACCFWTTWNQRIEDACKDRPYYFKRVEEAFKPDFFEFLGIREQEVKFRNKKTNTMRKRDRDFSIEEIPDGKAKEDFLAMRKRYGYPLAHL
jgi:hypothetical protein